MNAFEIKGIEANELGAIYTILGNRLKDYDSKYDVVGKEEEQATDWRTGELLWEDEAQTIPKYKNKYGFVPKSIDDFTEEDVVRIELLKKVMKMLEKAL